MNSYEDKQQRRRERLEQAAQKARDRANDAHRRSDALVEHIPLGQPILVGHHSERGHRRTLERSRNLMFKMVEENQRAADLERKADSVGRGGISSDDPEAVTKLKDKLAKLQREQDQMKAANKVIRQKLGSHGPSGTVAALVELGFNSSQAYKLLTEDFCGRIGFPDYALQNNNGNMRRIKERIAELESRQSAETSETEVNGVRIVENVEENRLQLFFPDKPAESVRRELKSYGFRWSRHEGCWQRHLTESAKHIGRTIAEQLNN